MLQVSVCKKNEKPMFKHDTAERAAADKKLQTCYCSREPLFVRAVSYSFGKERKTSGAVPSIVAHNNFMAELYPYIIFQLVVRIVCFVAAKTVLIRQKR